MSVAALPKNKPPPALKFPGTIDRANVTFDGATVRALTVYNVFERLAGASLTDAQLAEVLAYYDSIALCFLANSSNDIKL